jgi:hypothetical protein
MSEPVKRLLLRPTINEIPRDFEEDILPVVMALLAQWISSSRRRSVILQ